MENNDLNSLLLSMRRCICFADYASALRQLATLPESCNITTIGTTPFKHMLSYLLDTIIIQDMIRKPEEVDTFLDLFRALLRIYPPAVHTDSLLHRLCSWRTKCPTLSAARNGCIHIILDEEPNCIMQRAENSWLPLHFACAGNLPLEILQVLVNKEPTSVHYETDGGTTALNILWDQYAMDDSYTCTISRYCGSKDIFGTDLWKKVVLLAEAAFYSNPAFTRYKVPSLLAFAAIPHTTTEMMKVALFKCRSSIQSKDSFSGDNLLHMCISCHRSSSTHRCSNMDMIHLILQADSSLAKQVNHLGRYPLMYGALSGIEWEDGLSNIFHAFPEAIMLQDPQTKLFPFMAAKSTQTIYQILREYPASIVQGCARNPT